MEDQDLTPSESQEPLEPQEPQAALVEYCEFCSTKAAISTCSSCKKRFCIDHQSRQSIFHCQDCFNNAIVEDHRIKKLSTKYSIHSQKTITRVKSCRQIVFNGEAWRKQTALIHTLEDKELHDMLELTRASINLMEQEILQRNIEAARKKAEANVILDRRQQAIQNAKPPVKVVIKTTKSKDSGYREKLKKSGISKDIIQKMLAELQREKEEKEALEAGEKALAAKLGS